MNTLLKKLLAKFKRVEEVVQEDLSGQFAHVVEVYHALASGRRDDILSRIGDLEKELADLKKVLSAVDGAKSSL